MSKALHEKIREQGAADFRTGKPIDAFYEMPLPAKKRQSELYRSSYVTGWSNAQAAARSSDQLT